MNIANLGSLDATRRNMEAGVWIWNGKVPDTPEEAATLPRMKIRHGLSDAYQEVRREEEKLFRRSKGYRAEKELTEEEQLEITRSAMSKGLLIDWANWTDEKNEPESYSHKAALRRLENPLFFVKFSQIVAQEENFYQENLQELAGN